MSVRALNLLAWGCCSIGLSQPLTIGREEARPGVLQRLRLPLFLREDVFHLW
jgi:hypothetical protein